MWYIFVFTYTHTFLIRCTYKQIYILLKILNYVHLKNLFFHSLFFHLTNGVRGLQKVTNIQYTFSRWNALRLVALLFSRYFATQGRANRKKNLRLFRCRNTVKLWGITLFFHILHLCIHFISRDWCNAKYGMMDLWRQPWKVCWKWGIGVRTKFKASWENLERFF